MNRKVISPRVLPVVIMLLVVGCGKEKRTFVQEAPLPVEVSTAIVRKVTLTNDYPGYLVADAAVELVGRVNGELKSKNFVPGQRVRKGDLLFVIEPTQYEDAVTQAEASLQTSKASLEYARSNYTRLKEAIKSNAVSEIQLLQAESNVKEGEASVNNATASLKSARTTLGYCYVRAPYDGQISRCPYSVGDYISGGASPVKLATVYKDDVMYSYFNVTENQWLAQMQRDEETRHKPGYGTYQVTISLPNQGNLTWKAELDYLSPDITRTTGTLEVRARMKNPDGLLKSGAYVTVTLPYGEVPQGVLVNDASIGTDQLGKYLYVVNDSNVVHYRPIQVGQLVDDTLRLVTGGLFGHERYVTKALLKVHDGMVITPQR